MSDDNQRQFLVNYIVDQLAGFLIEDLKISLESALDIVYSSPIYDLLLDEGTGLTANSPSYVYELLKSEIAV